MNIVRTIYLYREPFRFPTEGGPEESRILLKEHGKDLPDEDVEVQKWNKLIRDHKW